MTLTIGALTFCSWVPGVRLAGKPFIKRGGYDTCNGRVEMRWITMWLGGTYYTLHITREVDL